MRLTLALFFVALSAAAQTPEVPHKMDFAGMTLTIRDDARREIQKDVNALTQSPRHHLIKVERARTYFPLIEKVFAEEQIPDDFKYLVLQESALIADAVSVSNAVGFWQFKDFTAVEMGLRVDKDIDERLNIVSSSRAAARYIKKNNTFFNNWVYALQAYQMGAGGVMRTVGKGDHSASNMEITSNTYWYVKKFLAHKIAFEPTVSGAGQIKVIPYVNSTNKHLKDLAREVSVDELELQTYNKWAKKGTIPGDRSYTVLIPMKGDGVAPELPVQILAANTAGTPAAAAKPSTTSAMKGRTKINGISAIRPEANETPATLASRAGVSVSDFVKWNDISTRDRLQADTYYLLGKKRARATVNYHTAEVGDNLWKISQRYGVQLKKLKRYNRLSGDEDFQAGTSVYLSSMKPKSAVKEKQTGPVAQVEGNETFAWDVDPSATASAATEVPAKSSAALSKEKDVTDQSVVVGAGASAKPEYTPASPSPVEPVTGATVELETSSTEVNGAETISGGNTDTQPAGIGTVSETASPNPVEVKETSPEIATRVTPPDSVGTISPTPAPLRKGKATHTVVAGETLYGIAREYSVGVMDLVEWNSLNLQQGIKPGQVLKMRPTEEETAAPEATGNTIEHVVKSTDTLYSVARKYNVTIKELMDWNKKKDFSLAIGEKLIVRGQ